VRRAFPTARGPTEVREIDFRLLFATVPLLPLMVPVERSDGARQTFPGTAGERGFRTSLELSSFSSCLLARPFQRNPETPGHDTRSTREETRHEPHPPRPLPAGADPAPDRRARHPETAPARPGLAGRRGPRGGQLGVRSTPRPSALAA